MKVSAKTEYACLAMLELASSFGSDEPVRIRAIAEKHGIPSRFLVQILLQLKGAGLVQSTRGAAGGYRLVVPPQEVTLARVISAITGPRDVDALENGEGSPAARVLKEVWRDVCQVEQQMLEGVTFADLLERAKGAEDMYYI